MVIPIDRRRALICLFGVILLLCPLWWTISRACWLHVSGQNFSLSFFVAYLANGPVSPFLMRPTTAIEASRDQNLSPFVATHAKWLFFFGERVLTNLPSCSGNFFNALFAAGIIFTVLIQQKIKTPSKLLTLRFEVVKSGLATVMWVWLMLWSMFRNKYPSYPKQTMIIRAAMSGLLLPWVQLLLGFLIKSRH